MVLYTSVFYQALEHMLQEEEKETAQKAQGSMSDYYCLNHNKTSRKKSCFPKNSVPIS